MKNLYQRFVTDQKSNGGFPFESIWKKPVKPFSTSLTLTKSILYSEKIAVFCLLLISAFSHVIYDDQLYLTTYNDFHSFSSSAQIGQRDVIIYHYKSPLITKSINWWKI